MGNKVRTPAADDEAREEYQDRAAPEEGDETSHQSTTGSFLEAEAEDEAQAGADSADAYPDLESAYEARSNPERRAFGQGQNQQPADDDETAGTPATQGESDTLSAAERHRTKSPSLWATDDIEAPTPEELREPDTAPDSSEQADDDMESAALGSVADVDPDLAAATDELDEYADDPASETEFDDGESAPETDESSETATTSPLADVSPPPSERDPVDIDDPDGYSEQYDTPETETETLGTDADSGGADEFFDPDLPSPGRLEVGQDTDRPGLAPNPEQQQGAEDVDAAVRAGDASSDEATTGNQTVRDALETTRDATRPTSFDQEYGKSARGSYNTRNPHWRADDNSTALGGIPSDPEIDGFSQGEDLDPDGWQKPATSVSEMQERFMVATEEVLAQRSALEERHGGDINPDAEAERARAIREQTSDDTGDADPETLWEAYAPHTTTRSLGGEEVEVATRTPETPPQTLEYDRGRAERIYRSFSDTLQENIDAECRRLADRNQSLNESDVRHEFVKQMELGSGTIDSDDVDAAALRVNSLEYGASTEAALKRTKGAVLYGQYTDGYGDQTHTTRGTMGVRDVNDVLDYMESEGFRDYDNRHEARGNVEGQVSGVINRNELNDGIDQIVYLSPTGELGSNTQLKLTIWDSGVNTTERAASNNAERDATGRTMDQTKDVPRLQPGDTVELSDIKIGTFRGDPAGQFDNESAISDFKTRNERQLDAINDPQQAQPDGDGGRGDEIVSEKPPDVTVDSKTEYTPEDLARLNQRDRDTRLAEDDDGDEWDPLDDT